MIYIICGPTGSGKTNAAHLLATYFNCPIINADAFQIYQDMDIGTAKIDKKDPMYQRYHLIDIVKPSSTYSVKEYQEAFRHTVKELSKQHDNIIVCGGTGLYIRASIFDYHFEDDKDIDTSDLEMMNDEELFSLLSTLDYQASLKIHPHNRKRVIRAIAIARSSHMTKSENIAKQEHKLLYQVRMLMINPPREELYENLNKRVEKMFADGLVEEVTKLKEKYELSLTARQAIGYKEILDYLEGKMDLESAKELIKQRTRNYAKRQVTFFKNQFDVEVFASSYQLVEMIKDGK